MDNKIVRLQSIEIKNIKNVKYGKINISNTTPKDNSYKSADILGVYGQNGSGKTAIIDVLFFVQQIIMGTSLDSTIGDYIDVESESAEINIEYRIYEDTIIYDVGYTIILKKDTDGSVYIQREYMNCSKIINETRSNKTIFIDYIADEQQNVFSPAKNYNELVSLGKELKTDLLVAKRMAEKINTSYIFNDTNINIFKQTYAKGYEYSKIILEVAHFMKVNLFVINNMHSGVISANLLLPMAFKLNNDLNSTTKGELAVSLMKPTVLNKKYVDMLEEIIEEINMVLVTIIPGMTIGIKNYGPQLTDDGTEALKIELTSIRGDKVIPIRMESDGIIKIISILNALIHAFSNYSVCLAIDELDAGIFEYMLGELLDVFAESGKGQLIFTSHNLRALEMLNKENIMFSTANPDNRYIHMKNIKKTNNLRDLYLRSITLGGQNEVIYEETDSLSIAKAFRKAGRKLKHE